MGQPRFTFLYLISLLGVAVMFSNCGEGGKARYDIEPISDDKAIELLETAENDPKKTDKILERVRTNRRGDFDFKKFWTSVKDREVVRRLTPAQQRKLLELHGESCKDTDFDEFVELVVGLRRFEFLVGEFRKCQQSLTPERTGDFILRMLTELPAQDLEPRTVRRRPRPPQTAAQQPEPPKFLTDPKAGSIEELEHWYMLQQQEAGNEGKAADVTPEEKESLVSSFLLREILRSPGARWGATVCYLSDVDFALLEQGLRARKFHELASRLKTTHEFGCHH